MHCPVLNCRGYAERLVLIESGQTIFMCRFCSEFHPDEKVRDLDGQKISVAETPGD